MRTDRKSWELQEESRVDANLKTSKIQSNSRTLWKMTGAVRGTEKEI